MDDLGLGPAPGLLSALAFTALGCLPAVVVHSVLRAQPRDTLAGQARGLVAVAYGLSAVAGLIHVGHALSGGEPPAASALQVQTVGFTALAVPLVLATRRQDGWRRAFWLVALAVFAVSALHLSEHDDFTSPWWVQVLGHHASLPLAVAILSQDYPFAFGDLLLKRILALGALVLIAVSGLLLLSMLAARRAVPLRPRRAAGPHWLAPAHGGRRVVLSVAPSARRLVRRRRSSSGGSIATRSSPMSGASPRTASRWTR